MGARLGLIFIGVPDQPLDVVARVAARACVKSEDVVLFYEPSVDVSRGVDSKKRVGMMIVSAGPAHPGVDNIGEALRDALGVHVLATYVNDFYQSGGYLLLSPGPREDALLVDGMTQVAGRPVSYRQVPLIGLANMLECSPILDRPTLFPEDVRLDQVVRLVKDGKVLGTREPLTEEELDEVDVRWATGMIEFPTAVRHVRRQLAERQAQEARTGELLAKRSLSPTQPLAVDAVESLFEIELPAKLREVWNDALAGAERSELHRVLGLYNRHGDLDYWLGQADSISRVELAPATRAHPAYRLLPFASFSRQGEDEHLLDDVVFALDVGRGNGSDYEVVEIVNKTEIVSSNAWSTEWLHRELPIARALASLLEASYGDDKARTLLGDAWEQGDDETIERWIADRLNATRVQDEALRDEVTERFFERFRS